VRRFQTRGPNRKKKGTLLNNPHLPWAEREKGAVQEESGKTGREGEVQKRFEKLKEDGLQLS